MNSTPDAPPARPSRTPDTNTAPPGPHTPAAPVAPDERYQSLDAIRGFALLGIFAMNIIAFALPYDAYVLPGLFTDTDTAGRVAITANTLLFEQRMMSLFAMLFGAGIVVFTDRAERKGHAPAALHYRRMGWLLVIGLAHAYLLWYGDILVPYAVIGSLAFLFRKASPRLLFALAPAFIAVSIAVSVGLGLLMGLAPEDQITPPPDAAAASAADQADAIDEGYLARLRHQAPQALKMQVVLLPIQLGPALLGLMLLGMALLKAGVLTATVPARRLLLIAAATALPAAPLAIATAAYSNPDQPDLVRFFLTHMTLNTAAAALLATAYASLIAAAVRARVLAAARSALANVGRLAFTNYILQTIFGCLVFYRPGLGLFNDLSRAELWIVVLAVWASQIAFSTLYLQRFSMGPLEWLWRSLTYARFRPLPRAPRHA